jgi:1-acyl-sn-glycerol-3-phosphate acyltransferase
MSMVLGILGQVGAALVRSARSRVPSLRGARDNTVDTSRAAVAPPLADPVAPADATQESFAGGAHHDARSDLRWVCELHRDGNTAIRALSLGIRLALRRCASNATIDRPSFERALAAVPAGAIVVLAPSHRSYLDFLLASYLCFHYPEFGVAVPHIAAAAEFGQIPVLGRLLRSARAFYLQRGVGHASPELSRALHQLAADRASLMFFIEGQRSRSRMALAPKRGLLRGLQATGCTFAVLPIAFSYDRIPEERALERELAGHPRARMRLAPLLAWLARLARGQVALGRIHVACGELQVLDAGTDIQAIAHRLVAEQQRHTTVTSFHLRAFLAEAALDPALGIDEAWLAAAIRARGGRVLESSLAVPALSSALAVSLRNQWAHWFYGDALVRYPDHPAVADHVRRHAWLDISPPYSVDDRVAAVVDALLAPIAAGVRTSAAPMLSPRLRQGELPVRLPARGSSAYS